MLQRHSCTPNIKKAQPSPTLGSQLTTYPNAKQLKKLLLPILHQTKTEPEILQPNKATKQPDFTCQQHLQVHHLELQT